VVKLQPGLHTPSNANLTDPVHVDLDLDLDFDLDLDLDLDSDVLDTFSGAS